jgi:hypothetical protein
MILISAVRKMPGVMIALVAIAAVMVISQPARSYSGNIGYLIKVEATPTVGLTDGQAVAVHVDGNGGLPMYDLQAHLCQAGAGVKNGFEFDLDGPYCSPSKVSPAADAAVEQKVSGSSADLTFHVGVGTGAPWNETDGGVHTLTCGPGAPCDLVLQVAINGTNVYHAIPLCFGDGCGPEPTASSAPAGSSTGDGGQPKGAAAASSGSNGSSDGNDAGSGINPHGGNPATNGTGSNGGNASATGASRNGSSTGATGSSQALGDSVTPAASEQSPIAPWRIALAGIAGLLCGARIVSVIGRVRRTRVGLA